MIFPESLLKTSPWHPQHVRTRREILSEMQKVALFKIESYWLPNFYIHCKLSMEKEPKCNHMLEQYEERLYRVNLPVYTLTSLPAMSIRESCIRVTSYSSLKSRTEVWDCVTGKSHLEGTGKHTESESGNYEKQKPYRSNLIDVKKHRLSPKRASGSSDWQADCIKNMDRLDTSDEISNFNCSPSVYQSSTPILDKIGEKTTFSKLRSSTPVVQFPSMLAMKTIVKSPMSFYFLPWALTADKCAGHPFREFLLNRNYAVEVHLLDLWHDLEDFLRMLLCSLGEGNVLLRHFMGERICELYLTQKSNWHLPLKLTTLRSLHDLLPSGNVIPWVLKAQKEICKVGNSHFFPFKW